VIKEMAKDPRIRDVVGPILFHPDLHKRNIFVSDEDPTVITAIIDWQSTGILPAFWYANDVPDFAEPVPDPSDRKKLEPKSETCAKAHNVCTQILTPALAKPRLMDDNLFRPIRFCSQTWQSGAAAFREELIQTSRRWGELGFEGSCPFPVPSPEELAVHKIDFGFFKTEQMVRGTISTHFPIQCDGWVQMEFWDGAVELNKEAFGILLQAVMEEQEPDEDDPDDYVLLESEADVREIWPFDLDV
jgi:hypothetical protein